MGRTLGALLIFFPPNKFNKSLFLFIDLNAVHPVVRFPPGQHQPVWLKVQEFEESTLPTLHFIVLKYKSIYIDPRYKGTKGVLLLFLFCL